MIIRRENNIWSAHILANNIMKKFDSNNNLVYSSTWSNSFDNSIIENFLYDNEDKKVIYISLFDNEYKLDFKHERLSIINSKDFYFWLIAVDNFFIKYSILDVKPINFDNIFLCYQRKMFPEREYLYNQLKNKKGIITIGNILFDNINYNLPDHNGYYEVGGELTTPNDIWSLGNIDVWNKSFLNIVSETLSYNKNSFLSEKIFKPIIGMRPFLINGSIDKNESIKNLGFETFNEDFNYYQTDDYKNNAYQLSNIIDILSTDNIELFYKKLLPKIEYNKNHFDIAVKNEHDKLDNLVKNII